MQRPQTTSAESGEALLTFALARLKNSSVESRNELQPGLIFIEVL